MDNQASVDQRRLQSHKQKQTEKMKRFSVFEHNTHFKQETPTFCAEMSFPREGCIRLSLEETSNPSLTCRCHCWSGTLSWTTHRLRSALTRPLASHARGRGTCRCSLGVPSWTTPAAQRSGRTVQALPVCDDMNSCSQSVTVTLLHQPLILLHTFNNLHPFLCKPQHHLAIKLPQTVNVWDHTQCLSGEKRYGKSKSHFGSCCCVVAC